jgi:hypothetical protein
LRHHGEIARIEIDPAECAGGISPELMRNIAKVIKPLGFKWVCLDLEGYRMGSLNEALSNDVLSNEALSNEALSNEAPSNTGPGSQVRVDFGLPVLPSAK